MFTDTAQRHQCRMCRYCWTHHGPPNPRRAKDPTLAQNSKWDEWDLWSLSIWPPGTLNYIPLFGICNRPPPSNLGIRISSVAFVKKKKPLSVPHHNPSSTSDSLTPCRILLYRDKPASMWPSTSTTNPPGLNSAFAKDVLRSTKLQALQAGEILKTHVLRFNYNWLGFKGCSFARVSFWKGGYSLVLVKRFW